MKRNIRELLGEVSADEIDIEIGDIVKVEIYGRLNEASQKEIRVGKQVIDTENITKIENRNEEENIIGSKQFKCPYYIFFSYPFMRSIQPKFKFFRRHPFHHYSIFPP